MRASQLVLFKPKMVFVNGTIDGVGSLYGQVTILCNRADWASVYIVNMCSVHGMVNNGNITNKNGTYTDGTQMEFE